MNAAPLSVLRRTVIALALMLPCLTQAASTWRPIVDARSLSAVWMSSATSGIQVGESGLVRRTSDGGATWVTESAGTAANLHAVWGSDASHVWAVGDGGVIQFWNGTAWTAQKSSSSVSLRGVSGTAANNVFAVGDGGTVRRFTGTGWVTVVSGLTNHLRGVWAANASNIWIVGDGGKISKWNGSAFTPQASGVTSSLRAVSGIDATHVWAVGDSGVVRYFDGSTWASQLSGTTVPLTGTSAADATHVWATSQDGKVLFFDGTSWAVQFTSSPIEPLTAIWVSSVSVAIAVGDVLTTLVWDGLAWAQTSSTAPDIAWNSAWGTDDSDMWIVGNGGTIGRWNGATLSLVPSGTAVDLLKVWGLNATTIYAVGRAGTILKWDGTTWTPQASGTTNDILALWGSATNDLWAVTSGSRSIRHFDGTSWTSDYIASENLFSVWGLGTTDVWAVGDNGLLAHHRTGAWFEARQTSFSKLNAVWGLSGNAMFTVGDGGRSHKSNSAVLNFWPSKSTPTTENLLAIAGVNDTNVWAVGGSSIIKFNGTAWTDDVPAKNVGNATSVWATGANAVFVTTSTGAIFVNSPVGTGEIALEQPAGTPLLANATLAFGTVNAALPPVPLQVTIKSLGASALTGLSISKTGTGAAAFVVTGPLSTNVSTGNSTTFDIAFQPTVTGAHTASIIVTSNDADESPFVINVTGTGLVRPTITTQPVSKTVNPGAAVSFTVAVSNAGTSPFTYAWERFNTGTMAWEPVTGAVNNQATLTLTPATDAKEGDYHVIVSNVTGAAGAVTSNTATLNVNTAVLIIAPPLGSLAKTFRPVGSDTASFTVTVDPTATLPLTYVWRKNGATISGATVTNSSAFSDTFTIPSVAISHGGEITCLVKNVASPSGVASNKAQLTVVDGTARTLVQATGSSTTLTATVGGTAISYAWKKGVNPVTPDLNHVIANNKLTIKNIQLSDDDSYTCEVTGAGGTVVGGPFDLIVVDSVPALATGETSPLNLGTAIVSGNYTYDIKLHLDSATNKTASSFSCSGLPTGLKCDALTGIISGKPAVTLTLPKAYTIGMTVSNAKGRLVPPLPATSLTGTLTVNPPPTNLVGVYVGSIARHPSVQLNSDRGGRLDLTVTSTGTYSGKVTLGALSAASFSGVMDTSTTGGGTVATEVTTVVRKLPLTNLTLTFTIDLANNLLSGTLVEGANSATISGWRNKWSSSTQATAYTGLHTFKLEGPGIADAAAPQGIGYGSFKPTITSGATTVAGRLADGVSYSTGGLLGPTGELLIFQASTTADCLLGTLKVATDATHTITSTGLDWSRAPQAANATIYKTGFGSTVTPSTATSATAIAGHALVPLTAGGGLYVAPVSTATPPANILLLVTDGGVGTTNARVNFSDAELGDSLRNPAPEPDIAALRLSATAKVNPILAADNPRGTSLSPDATNGLFSGKFTLVDPRDTAVSTGSLTVSRTSNYFGAIVFEAGVPKGYGFFLLAKRPIINGQSTSQTEQLSGKVVFEKNP